MAKKYFDTKPKSLESSILGIWEEQATKMDARTKAYKEHRAKLEARRGNKIQEKLVGGQKKLDKDKDGDIDGADFAAMRKAKKKNEEKTAREVWEDAIKAVNEWKKKSKKEEEGDDVEDEEEEDDDEEEMMQAREKTDTGKKSSKIEINPKIETKDKR